VKKRNKTGANQEEVVIVVRMKTQTINTPPPQYTPISKHHHHKTNFVQETFFISGIYTHSLQYNDKRATENNVRHEVKVKGNYNVKVNHKVTGTDPHFQQKTDHISPIILLTADHNVQNRSHCSNDPLATTVYKS
jgi:hypothetical protein